MIVWVSGASSGLGLHTACQLTQAGMTVVAGARSYREKEGEAENGYRLYLAMNGEDSSLSQLINLDGVFNENRPTPVVANGES